jgi:hypothetical protein
MEPNGAAVDNSQQILQTQLHRRRFLKLSGGIASVALVGMVACDKDDKVDNGGIDLGSGDVGVLNYAYALEQLEAAFYIQVMATPFSGMTALETEFLRDIRDHEIVHREFFKNALKDKAIPGLEVDFSSINFGNRASVLGTAKAFEDLGVAAYNGAGKLLTDVNNLLVAGKIVSVEARHAALIRELLVPNSFADLTSLASMGADNSKALDAQMMPKDVLAIAGTYVKTKINANNLPTS